MLDEEKRNQLSCLLVDLSLKETRHELNRYLEKKDKENGTILCKVEDAITTLLEYLER